jgi:hypothetical protein
VSRPLICVHSVFACSVCRDPLQVLVLLAVQVSVASLGLPVFQRRCRHRTYTCSPQRRNYYHETQSPNIYSKWIRVRDWNCWLPARSTQWKTSILSRMPTVGWLIQTPTPTHFSLLARSQDNQPSPHIPRRRPMPQGRDTRARAGGSQVSIAQAVGRRKRNSILSLRHPYLSARSGDPASGKHDMCKE